ncbi:MAG: hypothetical protein HY428_01245 [Candidatus Levybacteria bacterium]|nr:hypothetical protein [Candidatus Levybacteria bacterium]
MRSAYAFLFRALFVLLALAFLIGIATPKVNAQAPYTYPTPSTYSSSHVDPSVPRNDHTRAQIVLQDVMAAVICQLVGIDPIDPVKGCVGIDPVTRKLGYVNPQADKQDYAKPGGAMGFMTDMIGMTYTKPFGASEYVSHLASNFGIVRSAIAQEPINETSQGEGFSRFKYLFSLFVMTRNVAYMLLVIFFVIIGLAIMLRVKIDPRTVMTIQNQLPKIVVGILLITFSYAIAGAMVDLMWVGTYFSVNTLTEKDTACALRANGTEKPGDQTFGEAVTNSLLDNPLSFVNNIFGDTTGCAGSFDGISGLAWGVGTTIGDILGRSLMDAIGLGAPDGECNFGFLGIGGDVGACFQRGIFGFLKYAIGLVAFLILFISLLISLIKIWFLLIKAYIQVILDVIIAPLWIVMGLIPGSSLGFGSWFRHLMAHLLVFPAAAIMFIFARILAISIANDPTGNTFIPPLVGNPNIADNMSMIIAVGFIFITPDMLNILRDAIKSAPVSKYGGNISRRAAGGAGGGALQTAGQMGLTLSGLRMIPVVNKLPFIRGTEQTESQHAAADALAKSQEFPTGPGGGQPPR